MKCSDYLDRLFSPHSISIPSFYATDLKKIPFAFSIHGATKSRIVLIQIRTKNPDRFSILEMFFFNSSSLSVRNVAEVLNQFRRLFIIREIGRLTSSTVRSTHITS